MSEEVRKDRHGLWAACNIMELNAHMVLKEQLGHFEELVETFYELWVQVPTLAGKRHQEFDMRCAALFLKKSLNDLRSAWILLGLGYTSQAASVTASLYENALAAAILAGDSSNAQKFRDEQSGDLPWKPQQLAQMMARKDQNNAISEGQNFDQNVYEESWRFIYAGYKWLCKIKHPTFRSAIHDSFSASVKEGEYVVMAAPDIREEDMPVKTVIIMIALNRIIDAIKSFAIGLDCDESPPIFEDFRKKMIETSSKILDVSKSAMKHPLPFTIRDSSLFRELDNIKSSKK